MFYARNVGSKERAHFCAGLIHRNVPAFSGRYLKDVVEVMKTPPRRGLGVVAVKPIGHRDDDLSNRVVWWPPL